MFEDEDFELDDVDFISSSFTTSQPKWLDVDNSKVENFGSTINLSQSQQNLFKKPQESVSRPTRLPTQTENTGQRQRPHKDHLHSETLTSNVFNLKSFRRKESRSSSTLENNTQLKKVAKRKFPGPAGVISNDKSVINNQELSDIKKFKEKLSENIHENQSKQTSIFDDGPWKEMAQDFRALHPANVFLPDKYNIRWIKSNASLRRLIDKKVPFLAAVVQNIQANSSQTCINLTLKDATGEIQAAILHTLFREYSRDITTGSVIVLKQFGVFTTGIDTHHVTIAPNNLITIYSKYIGKYSVPDTCKDKNSSTSCTNDGVRKTLIQKVTSEELIRQAALQNQILSCQETETTKMGSKHSEKRNILSLNHDRKDLCRSSSLPSAMDRFLETTSIGLHDDKISNVLLNHTQEEAGESFNLSGTKKIENCFLHGIDNSQIENNVSRNTYTSNTKEKVNFNRKKSHIRGLSGNHLTDNTFKCKKIKNIFDTDDDFNLTLGEEFCTDTDFESEIIIKRDSKERNKSALDVSKIDLNTKKCDNNSTVDEALPPNICITSENGGIQPRDVKIKAALQKFKFKPRNNDEVKEQLKSETEIGSETMLSKDQGKDVIIDTVKGQDLGVDNSQMSVKSTNVEHNKIWKNLFDDIDTDSLFDDF